MNESTSHNGVNFKLMIVVPRESLLRQHETYEEKFKTLIKKRVE